jgi:hypothetical protein
MQAGLKLRAMIDHGKFLYVGAVVYLPLAVIIERNTAMITIIKGDYNAHI